MGSKFGKDRMMDRLLENEELLQAMLAMPRSWNRQLATERREELFGFIWKYTDMDRAEVMNMVNQRELDFIRNYDHIDIPDWIIRLEAQDVLLEVMHKRFQEEGIIDG